MMFCRQCMRFIGLTDPYKKDVLNAIETPREREFRILARRKEAADNE